MPVRVLGAVRRGLLPAWLLVLGLSAGWSQNQAAPVTAASPLAEPSSPTAVAGANSLTQWEGLPVRRISFEGISVDRLAALGGHLALAEGKPLTREDLQRTLRQLFATGLFETIAAEGARDGDGVALVFRGAPRTFIGTVSVEGAKGGTINTQLERASQLAPGTRFTPAKLREAQVQMRSALAQNGFHEPVITPTLTQHPEEQLVDIAFHVVSGTQARVGTVAVTGDPGMSAEEFRRHAHLKEGAHVDHETTSRALAGVLKQYQKQERLEAEIKLESDVYAPDSKKANFRFSATRGPIVNVRVEGANMSPGRVKRVIPIFEEGTVDDDLLNEGNRRLRDYYQRLGYFDVKVEHEQQTANAEQVVILYRVQLGQRRRVERVKVAGNRYFPAATLLPLLNVRAADTIDHHGLYSQALVSADINAIQAVYQNNGFSKVKITPETSTPETAVANGPAPVAQNGKKIAPLIVVYRIEEGEQLRVGAVALEGNDHVEAAKLVPLMNTAAGQLLSPQNLAGDRDALLTAYMSRGFDHVQVGVEQKVEPGDPSKVDVAFHITEGQQVFVRKVLLTGLHYTRPSTVARAITLHPGDPLDETALAETQRNMYEFALFTQVDTAVENPTGGETYKTILLQASEARRWALTYGFGFEAQTGTPQNNCRGANAIGIPCNPNGKTGVSPRVLADITRNNLFGREQSVSLRGTYGLLEQRLSLLFQNPHFEGNRNFGLTFSAGYANSQDVTTYVASRLEADMRWTEHFNTPGSWISKANTLVYEYSFRRVKVAEDSLQVGPFALNQLSTAVRVAGPGLTWIRDTRDSALDAHSGTYTSFQDFLSFKGMGSEAQFNRLDVSNSNFFSFDKGRFVLARNTRYGQERAFGTPSQELIPLPERLYAGGTTSLRGFPINAAGPRDAETGYPIGGTGTLINSTELRLPPPTLPWLGDSVSLVLFHDMGNVFANASDAWESILRVRQPNRDTCKNLTAPSSTDSTAIPNGPINSTGPQGECSFNYFTHAPGVGLRYHTPIGPIRFDFSYNLNPPIYPVIYNYSQSDPTLNKHVGQADHFNFFFSLGQTF
ncbi:MAG: POTRA domain-containing protein [Terracidiphilus sp.]|nr:POTRA domain-containing protein [Terracidiphilus sp.]MDR3775617.1 POTRA domain-containing protein [Terracidiphilus sp.]